MKYNLAYEWFKQADKDLSDTIPEMYTYNDRRYW